MKFPSYSVSLFCERQTARAAVFNSPARGKTATYHGFDPADQEAQFLNNAVDPARVLLDFCRADLAQDLLVADKVVVVSVDNFAVLRLAGKWCQPR